MDLHGLDGNESLEDPEFESAEKCSFQDFYYSWARTQLGIQVVFGNRSVDSKPCAI